MDFLIVGAGIAAVLMLMVWSISRPGGRRVSRGPGPGAAGAVYDLLNEDKRKAIEIILEERAEYRDPETADDTPPA
jgi:hypothetical protein